ncbi:ABC transporter permease [Vineibacter terrae]|uniref:ABC transporter permease n=1 Tax=Vineibacter terrae TaxID=2586908 RepID=UPI002E364602|nr:ABC transporter permease [Vineibacter terrae]HEX2891176.1 ABC transporter permease [Vineibacter terrae]
MKRSTVMTAALLILPLSYIAVFFVVPLLSAVGASFGLPDFSVDSYRRLLEVKVYQLVFSKTLFVALETTIVCLALGYPTACFVASLSPRRRAVAVGLIALPFMLSVLVRNYVWMAMLQDTGIINNWLVGWGIVEQPIKLMYNELGVVIAMVNMLTPYVIFPVLASLLAIPRDLHTASASLGANRMATFIRVTLPLTAGGTAAGCLITFIVALGFYVTPAMLGGPSQMMIANLIAFNVKEVLNWSFAFALATSLLGATIVLYFAYRAVVPRGVALKAA